MRYYQMFRTKDEQKAWEKEMAEKNENFKVCMRMTAKQLKSDLPHINTEGFTTATVWGYKGDI